MQQSGPAIPDLPPPLPEDDEEILPVPFGIFVAQTYLPHAKLRKRSWKVDERIIRQHIAPAFGDMLFSSVTSAGVENWLQHLEQQGLAPSSCNRIFDVFRSICSLATEYGQLQAGHSPCTGIRRFRGRGQRERYLSAAEAQRLMAELTASPRQEALVLRLLLLTGARKSEILKARWEHVHLEQRLLTIPLSKSGKTRHIMLSDGAVAVLRSLPRQRGCPWLFPGRGTEGPRLDVYPFWDRLRRRLGLADVRIHDLRHSFASVLVNAGHSLYEVQHLLGHSTPQTTMRYAHLGQETLLAATEAVSACLRVPEKEEEE